MGSDGPISGHVFVTILTLLMYLICAGLLYLSMREHEKTLMYFGFLKGAFAKSIFLLFCAALVFPLKATNPETSEGGLGGAAYLNLVLGYILTVASFLQICKYCKRNKDTNEKKPVMEGEGDTTEGLIEPS